MNIEEKIEELEQEIKNIKIRNSLKEGFFECIQRQINSLEEKYANFIFNGKLTENLCSSTFNVQKKKGLSFEEASKMTYKLKKIKRKCWNKNLTIEVGNGLISMDKEILDNFHLHKLENDWEIIE